MAPKPKKGKAGGAGSAKGAKRKPAKKTKAAKRPSTAKKNDAAKSPKQKCFVVSPFGGFHDEYFDEIFSPAIKSAGLDPARADDLFRSSNIVHDIWHLVVSSQVLLADLTGKNPNVFYELGLAHAARKPVLLLTQSMEDVPFDLQALRVIIYDVRGPKWGEELRAQIKKGLEETLASPERSVLPTFLLEEPDEAPTVTEDEARLLGLQQQVESLRAEVRAQGGRGSGSRGDIGPEEAEAIIEVMLREGASNAAIIRRVSQLGAPTGWVRGKIASLS